MRSLLISSEGSSWEQEIKQNHPKTLLFLPPNETRLVPSSPPLRWWWLWGTFGPGKHRCSAVPAGLLVFAGHLHRSVHRPRLAHVTAAVSSCTPSPCPRSSGSHLFYNPQFSSVKDISHDGPGPRGYSVGGGQQPQDHSWTRRHADGRSWTCCLARNALEKIQGFQKNAFELHSYPMQT